jgi:O-acetyl-ADP-ribose deacetylase (regulator of RNase III)
MHIQIYHTIVEAIQGDISNQPDLKAIVNAANAELQSGGGVAGAIHKAAGPGLARECRPMAPIKAGQAVLSGGHNLPNPFVIHCLGPVYGFDKPEELLLASCYRRALQIANENHIESIAFPALSTGAFGYPLKPATEIALDTIIETIPELKNIRLIRMVLYDHLSLKIHQDILSKIKTN